MKTVSSLIMQIQKYRVRGVISQADGDQGDSLNRTGVYYASLAALSQSPTVYEGLLFDLTSLAGTSPGRFRRGNDASRWFYNENNVTRDQMVTVEAAMALTDLRYTARAHFWARAKRAFIHFSTQNDGADAGPLKFKLPDICTPSEFGTLIRATKYKALYFLLPLTDLALYIDVAFSRSLSERALYDSDNQLLPQVLAALNEPTFVTEFVRRKYATTDAAARLRSYYSEADGSNGIEPLGELAALAFERAVGGLSDESSMNNN